MPKELIRINSGIRWRRTVIQPRQDGLETELQFEVAGRPFSVTFNSFPEWGFLHRVAEIRCLAILEFSSVERGWVEPGRYQIRINDDDEIDDATATADDVQWEPADIAGEDLALND